MSARDEQHANTVDRQRIRLLLVDDEANLTTLMKMNLEQLGPYEVRMENDPRRALAAAQAFRPDVIILDFLMPGLNGAQVAVAIQADGSFKNTLGLFLTGSVNRQNVGKWADNMSWPCLTKPVTAEALNAWIEAHLPKK